MQKIENAIQENHPYSTLLHFFQESSLNCQPTKSGQLFIKKKISYFLANVKISKLNEITKGLCLEGFIAQMTESCKLDKYPADNGG